jgi:signal transduction histidine kinase/DNA-binding response OmpR family regulator
MRRLSIARTVVVALLGLTVLLAVLAGLGVASLYDARQRYENRLSQTYQLQTAAGQLLAAAVVEEATARTAPGPAGYALRLQAQNAFNEAISRALAASQGDAADTALIRRIAAEENALRAGPTSAVQPLAARQDIAALSTSQIGRRKHAQHQARSDTRKALVAIILSGTLAVLAAIGLVAFLITRMRSPLDDLVATAERLASGDLEARAKVGGPVELQTLGSAFNTMADALADALGRVQQERRRLERTIESLGDALLLIDGDGVVVAANPRAAELVPELPVGARMSANSEAEGPDGTAASGEDRVLPPLSRALAGEVIVERGPLTLAATAAPVDDPTEEGGRPQTVWTLRDVTERARLERLKSEFVATASHELRSPLTSIKGFVELLAHGTDLDARQREFVDIVLQSTNRLVELVNDLLDVARIEAGQIEVSLQPVDLRQVVREVAVLMGPRLNEKQQDLELELPEDVPRAQADGERMRQIVTNLLTNAHLYTQAGGHLGVALRAGESEVAVVVSDDGPGMDHEQLMRIFERFYRGSQRERGTGLGLSIVKSLVDLQGGRIDVKSAPGKGTRFAVALPIAAHVPTMETIRAALRGRRVLVIDDDEAISRLITERLDALGVRAEAVHDGLAALERLRAEPWDAITLDILMPGMSGFEVLRQLRADPQLASIPVVVVSVFSAREALAGEWVVSKPIDPERLSEALGSAVLAHRVRVLTAARPAQHEHVTAILDKLGVSHDWAPDRATAESMCALRRYEIALVDAGLPGFEEVIAHLDLRGRRPGRAVLVFGPDDSSGLTRLGVLSVEELPAAVLGALADQAGRAADGTAPESGVAGESGRLPAAGG